MKKNIGAIITGGDFQALGALRTLARKNIPVCLIDSEACIGKYSRFAHKFFKSPPLKQEKAYIRFLTDLAETQHLKDWVLFPNSDAAVYVISKNKELLEKYYTVPTQGWDVIKNLYIKKNTYQIAEAHHIPIPKTYYPQSESELEDLDITYPVVMKPSIRDHFYDKIKIKAYLIKNRNALLKTFQFMKTIVEPSEILIQEYIPGGPSQLYSFCPFFKEGKIIAGISARRTRQHPMDFGHATTFAETVHVPEIEKLAADFLNIIGYYGIAEVEFMKDPDSGQFKLIEVNPRIWGWHSLSIAAGADLPYLLYQDSLKQTVQSPKIISELKWIRLTTDIPTVLLEILKGRIRLNDYLNSLKGKKEFAVWSVNDPLPFFMELLMLPYLYMKRGF